MRDSGVDKLLLLARKLRSRAEEIVIRAETFRNAEAREKMLQIAASYENLADRLEKESELVGLAPRKMRRRV